MKGDGLILLSTHIAEADRKERVLPLQMRNVVHSQTNQAKCPVSGSVVSLKIILDSIPMYQGLFGNVEEGRLHSSWLASDELLMYLLGVRS